MKKTGIYNLWLLRKWKTQFLRYTISQDYFQIDENSLLICCEEGMEEYDEKALKEANTDMVVIDELEDFNVEKLIALDKQYNPERILIEYNGMWDAKTLSFLLTGSWHSRLLLLTE